jgi:hypothetical protein
MIADCLITTQNRTEQNKSKKTDEPLGFEKPREKIRELKKPSFS